MSETTTASGGPEALSWTIGRVLTWSTDFLKDRSESPRLDAELLLAHALGLTRIQLYTQFDKPLTPAERGPFKGFLQRRAGGEPVAYIIGTKEFMGLSFVVSPAVLIPRPDTEVLVELVLRQAPKSILDVGTGSGCIAISLAKKIAGARVVAWDVEPAALAVARANAEKLGATVEFQQIDALSEAAWRGGRGGEAPTEKVISLDVAGAGERYDYLVSNPPYIAPAEAPDLSPSVARFEPHSALFAPPDGLAFYRAIARFGASRLNPGGRLAVEIGSTQAEAVMQILKNHGWQDVTVTKDYGRNDRVVTAKAPS